MQLLSDFIHQHDIDPAVKTVQVNSYRTGSGMYEKTTYIINGPGWTTLLGEFWYSRKTSAYVYRPTAYDIRYPQPPRDWLIDNTPDPAKLEFYS